jgi:hypothetical protein
VKDFASAGVRTRAPHVAHALLRTASPLLAMHSGGKDPLATAHECPSRGDLLFDSLGAGRALIVTATKTITPTHKEYTNLSVFSAY